MKLFLVFNRMYLECVSKIIAKQKLLLQSFCSILGSSVHQTHPFSEK